MPRLAALLITAILVVAGCGGRPGGASSPTAVQSIEASPVQTPTLVPTATGSATPLASALPATPSANPAGRPSLAGSYAVGDGTRKLALVCWGAGSPTVILETGGPNIEEWSGSAKARQGLVRQLAGHTRVCTYDRAGTGASDPPPYEKRDADDVVADLADLLDAALLDGPLVLVGRSFGGMIVTHYAEMLPADVVGVVVLDTPAPSATFTAESEPGLVWDYPGNTERLDVVGGFENRFAKDPPKIAVPLLVITPVPGESSAQDQRFWLQVSAESRQVTPSCGDSAAGPCADAVVDFVTGLQ